METIGWPELLVILGGIAFVLTVLLSPRASPQARDRRWHNRQQRADRAEGTLPQFLPLKAERLLRPARNMTRAQQHLLVWWPVSTGGSAALGVTLGMSFVASTVVTGEVVSGLISAGIWYFIIIGVRYVTVVHPSR